MKLNYGQFNTDMIAFELRNKGYDTTSELVKLLRDATKI